MCSPPEKQQFILGNQADLSEEGQSSLKGSTLCYNKEEMFAGTNSLCVWKIYLILLRFHTNPLHFPAFLNANLITLRMLSDQRRPCCPPFLPMENAVHNKAWPVLSGRVKGP